MSKVSASAGKVNARAVAGLGAWGDEVTEGAMMARAAMAATADGIAKDLKDIMVKEVGKERAEN